MEAKGVAGTCREILAAEESLYTFTGYPGSVAPTNNLAEQTLRHAVIRRKTSYGTHSRAGSIFVERILSTVATLRIQQRNVLEYLTAALQAQLHGSQAPSLIPASSPPVPLAA